MYRNTFIDNPIVISLFFLFITILNLLLPVHFLTILLVGIAYTVFSRSIESNRYYILSLMILAFCIVELTQGLKLFSLSLLAFFIHIFIAPILKRFFTSTKMIKFLLVGIFYFGVLLLFSFIGEITLRIFLTLLVNTFFEVLLVGVLF